MSYREFLNTLKISFLHFKIICEHKSWVSYYCKIAGLSRWQAFKHDLSKFSYTEFSESVKYYSGDKSPIENAKEINGYSLAWQHHKGRNPHHYEYWMDNFDQGTTAIRMPYKYAVEMVCDAFAAGQVYAKHQGKIFTFKEELKYYINKFDNGCAMHPCDKKFIYLIIRNLRNLDNIPIINDKYTMKCILKDKFFNKEILKDLYEYSSMIYDEDFKTIRESVEKDIKEEKTKRREK